jgi:hypothetical protein
MAARTYADLIGVLDGITSGERAFTEVQARWGIDRWFTFPAMLRSCAHTAARMTADGLVEARVEEFPADGRTVVGSWQMPLAWDVTDATLEVLEPTAHAGRLLCNYRAVPCGLSMWSAATPPEGLAADVVLVPTVHGAAAFDGIDVSGKIVFSDLRGNRVRNEAIRRGGVGVLSDHCRHPLEMPDAVDWMNAWSEDPGGWGLKDGEKNTWGFNVSHRQGQELRGWLAEGRVILCARVATRVYKGTLPVATGVLPGRQEEEVLVVAHGAEQGANDNASGCAVMLEALRALSVAIDTGKLPVPRRSIRALVSWEIYGTQAFYAAHVSRFRRTVAGLCLDMVGEDQEMTHGCTWLRRDPHVMLSYADGLSRFLAREYWGGHHPGYRWEMADFAMTDNIIADPTMGIPTPCVGADAGTDWNWHTSEDTPDKVSPANLKMMSTYAAAYLYVLATAGVTEVPFLADIMLEEAAREIRDRAATGIEMVTGSGTRHDLQKAVTGATRSVLYLAEVHGRAFATLERLVEAAERRVLQEVIALRRDALAREASRAREDLSDAFDATTAALGWKLSPEEVDTLTPEDREASGFIVQRTSFGSLSLDTIALGQRGDLVVDRFGGPFYVILTWCDGSRHLAEAARLASAECGIPLRGYLSTMKALAKLGLVRIVRA